MTTPRERILNLASDQLDALLTSLRRIESPTPARGRDEGATPLSYAQRAVWLDEQIGPRDASYNLSVILRIRGALDRQALAGALTAIARRHDVLRARFPVVDGLAVQQVAAPADVLLPLDHGTPEDLPRWGAAQADRPFDLGAGPVWAARLIRIADGDYALAATFHHLVCDSWSMQLFLREVAADYIARLRGEPSLPGLPVQYADYSRREHERLAAAGMRASLEFWVRQLAGITPLRLVRSAGPPVEAHARLDGDLVAGLDALATASHASRFAVLLAAFAVWLHRRTRLRDLAVAVPVAERAAPEFANVIGNFSNMLVVRVALERHATFQQAVTQVRERVAEAYRHADVPFQRIVEETRRATEGERAPLFHGVFNLRVSGRAALAIPGLEIDFVPLRRHRALGDLVCEIDEDVDGGLLLAASINSGLFHGTLDQLIGEYTELLQSVAADGSISIGSLAAPSADERRALAAATTAPYPDACLHDLFAVQARRTPRSAAILSSSGSITYGELDARSARLATRLLARGVRRGAPVGIFMDRGADLVAAILGTLRAGCPFLCLDPEYPPDRVRFMLEDSGAAAVVASRALASRIAFAPSLLCMDDGSDEGVAGELPRVLSDEPAYVIYTSGSTGLPKGVLGTHRGIVNRVTWGWGALAFETGEICCHKTSFGFVDSIAELFSPLLAGVPLWMAAGDVVRDPARLICELARAGVTRIVMVPSMLRALIETFLDLGVRVPRLTQWVISGEPLTPDLCRAFAAAVPHGSLVNLYGSSEVSADVTMHRVADPEQVAIGRPIANADVRVLDDGMDPVPPDVEGEIYAGGAPLAWGYVGRPDMTAERFVPDPMGAPGARLYRTGDCGRWRRDGTLEFVGRKDRQVKLRGHRIELSEIEAALRRLPGVADAAVLTRADTARADPAGGLELCAYVSRADGANPHAEDLLELARAQLPPFMLPAAVAVLDRLPRTPGGKIDRAALSAIPVARLRSPDREPPSGPVESALADMWQELLGCAGVRRHDDFLALGGHSLHAIRLAARISSRWGVDFPVREVFEARTLARLAGRVSQATQTASPSITIAVRHRPSIDELLDDLEPR